MQTLTSPSQFVIASNLTAMPGYWASNFIFEILEHAVGEVGTLGRTVISPLILPSPPPLLSSPQAARPVTARSIETQPELMDRHHADRRGPLWLAGLIGAIPRCYDEL